MIIIDCPDYVRFPSNIYHHNSTNKSHTVRPIGDQPQFHLIVIQMPNTPTNDVDIKQLWLKNRRGETVPDSSGNGTVVHKSSTSFSRTICYVGNFPFWQTCSWI